MLLSDFIRQYPYTDREIGQELENVAALAMQLDRKGKVVVTLTVEKALTRVQVLIGSKTTDPQPDAELGLFHLTTDGLTKNDPDQLFDLKTGEITTAARHGEERHVD